MTKYLLTKYTPALISISDIESIYIESYGSTHYLKVIGISGKEYDIGKYSERSEAEKVFNKLVDILSKNESPIWNKLNTTIDLDTIQDVALKKVNEEELNK